MVYLDELSKDNNSVKDLLVRQDLFDRTLDAERKKTRDSKELLRAFRTMITERNHSIKKWVKKETEIAREFKKLCKAEGLRSHSTVSETKAAFAERTIRSLKHILYRYMENNGYKYIHKLNQVVTTPNSRRNCSVDLIPRNVNNSDLLSILYSKPLREIRKPKFEIRDRVCISKNDVPFREGYKPQFLQEVSTVVAKSFRKPLTYTKNIEQDESIRGNFCQKKLIEVN